MNVEAEREAKECNVLFSKYESQNSHLESYASKSHSVLSLKGRDWGRETPMDLWVSSLKHATAIFFKCCSANTFFLMKVSWYYPMILWVGPHVSLPVSDTQDYLGHRLLCGWMTWYRLVCAKNIFPSGFISQLKTLATVLWPQEPAFSLRLASTSCPDSHHFYLPDFQWSLTRVEMA